MKLERTKNATRNMVFGGIQKFYSILAPFITRTIFIYTLGIEYLGLNSLFGSVLSVLNLAELGVGNAMVFSMYQAIAADDEKRICALLKLYKRYYTIIGWVILIAGVCITPFIPNLIKSDVPSDVNIYVLYLMNLAATVLTYWLYSYMNSLFSAFQRGDVASKISLGISLVTTILQICVLVLLKNYYAYVTIIIGMQMVSNLVSVFVVTRMYPQYRPRGNLPKAEVAVINQKIRDLFTSKIGTVVINSADTIVISAFLGLVVLAKYQNYYYIFTSVAGFVEIIFTSCMAGIGNSLLTETSEKNYTDFKKLTFIVGWIAGFCCTCFLCLYQPFMTLWVGKDLLLDFSIVCCLVVYFFIYEINRVINLYKDAAGMWHEDRFRPLATALVNLTMNLIMVQFIGLYGIILSTVLSMLFVGMPWLFHNLFTVIFDRAYFKNYFTRIVKYVVVTIVVCIMTYALCSIIEAPVSITFVVRFLICMVFPNVMLWLFYHKMPEYQQSKALLNKITRGRIKFLS